MHQTTLQQFQAAVQSGRLHHAWLLQGPRQADKRAIAEQWITLLLSEPEQRLWQQRAHPDIMVLDNTVATKTGTIPVEAVRDLITFAKSTKAVGQYKIILIDAVDNLNTNAANALLKLLEEPRPSTILLLLNHAPGAIPVTMRSRCRVVKVKVSDHSLSSSGVDIDDKTASAIEALTTQWQRLPIPMILQHAATLKTSNDAQYKVNEHLLLMLVGHTKQLATQPQAPSVQPLLDLHQRLTTQFQDQRRLMLDWGQVYLAAVLAMRRALNAV